MKYRGNAALVLVLVAACGNAAADEASLRRCRSIADASARLACYDAIGLPGVAARPGAASPLAPPASPAAAPAAAAGAAPAAAVPERFGFEERAARAAEARQPDRIESYIPGRFEGWRPNSQIRLANGQVWQVVDDSSLMRMWENPRVVVRRGALSGFFLDIEGDNRSPRVRRVR